MSPRCRCVASCIFLVLQANCSWKGHVCLSEVYHCCTFFQDESDVFCHLARFAAVGSCCCIAFRAKLYTGSGIIVRVFDQVMMFAFFLTDSTTVLLNIPWHSRKKNMSADNLFCFSWDFGSCNPGFASTVSLGCGLLVVSLDGVICVVFSGRLALELQLFASDLCV